jgi:hypothetical protein
LGGVENMIVSGCTVNFSAFVVQQLKMKDLSPERMHQYLHEFHETASQFLAVHETAAQKQ